MPITYTNRKGVTHHLCLGQTKIGKPRYYFAREPKEAPVEHMPEGYTISESVNGIVSLVKVRPEQIRSEEVAVVEGILRRHPKGRNYRVGVKHNRIEVYERVGPDAETLIDIFAGDGLPLLGKEGRLRDILDRDSQFTSVLRFILNDETGRTCRVERECYLRNIDEWIDLGHTGRSPKWQSRSSQNWAPTLSLSC